MRQDVLVMENLFYDRKIDKVFDTLNMTTPQLNRTRGWGCKTDESTVCGKYAGQKISGLDSGSSCAESPAKEHNLQVMFRGTYLCDGPALVQGEVEILFVSRCYSKREKSSVVWNALPRCRPKNTVHFVFKAPEI